MVGSPPQRPAVQPQLSHLDARAVGFGAQLVPFRDNLYCSRPQAATSPAQRLEKHGRCFSGTGPLIADQLQMPAQLLVLHDHRVFVRDDALHAVITTIEAAQVLGELAAGAGVSWHSQSPWASLP